MSTPDRKRVSIACTPCRKRKRRCDGQKPLCGLCVKESRQCEYTHHLEKRKPPTKCYIHALHARIALLENQLALAQRGMNGNSTAPGILEEPISPQVEIHTPSSGLSRHDLHDLPLSGLESLSSSAYGHLGLLLTFNDVPEANHQRDIEIIDGSLMFKSFELPLRPSLQMLLLENFWTWHNTWPLLVHEPLFRKDLAVNGACGYCTPTLLVSLLALSSHSTYDLQLESSSHNWNVSKNALTQQAKFSVLEEIEHPSLSLILSAAIISQLELLLENLASASQYIGIAIRHALTIGLHIETPAANDSNLGPTDIFEARSIAWAGVWMLEKFEKPPLPSDQALTYTHRHINRILGQPSAIRESEKRQILIPILPAVEYGLWPAAENSTILKLTSYCMSNFQLSCDLLQVVTPALETVYTISSSVSLEKKENTASETHVAMSEFYNNLPSPLRLPTAATKQLPPHVYQFNLMYQTLKIMLHRPFIRGISTMNSLHSLENPHSVHLQSATFSALRVSYIISSFRNFYPLHRLFPMAIESLVVASHIHILNSRSHDEKLAKRSTSLYRWNSHILNLMTPPGKESGQATRVLAALAQVYEIPTTSAHEEKLALRSRAEHEDIGFEDISQHMQAAVVTTRDSSTTVEFETPQIFLDGSINTESCFNWLDPPLNDQLLFNGALGDALWNDPYEEDHEYCNVPENYI